MMQTQQANQYASKWAKTTMSAVMKIVGFIADAEFMFKFRSPCRVSERNNRQLMDMKYLLWFVVSAHASCSF